jgi:hypothetical protein
MDIINTHPSHEIDKVMQKEKYLMFWRHRLSRGSGDSPSFARNGAGADGRSRDRQGSLLPARAVLYASNEFVADICRKNSDRLCGFASVNPKRKDAPSVLRDAVKNLGKLCREKMGA